MSRNSNLYVEIWKENLDKIIETIKNGGGEIPISRSKFEGVGDRQTYSFRLEVINTNVPRKNGQAQARDLKRVLDECVDFEEEAKGKTIIFRLTDDFKLEITIN